MKSYKLINLYKSHLFEDCYYIVLGDDIYLWLDCHYGDLRVHKFRISDVDETFTMPLF